MNKEMFYVLRISFHPEPKTEHIEQFSSQKDAEKHVNSFTMKSGEQWVIIKESNDSYIFVKGYKIFG